ncbi:MAG: beta-aspartyl-peptidase [Oscillospiraceae bacterium]|nr:beta-aspartyl-peptidase [Oscillospiraceae bacterium]
MLLIRNAEVYDPKYVGRRDVLVCGGQIEQIAEKIDVGAIPCKVIDGAGKRLIPGIIDQHVHITGGGGEGGFHTRSPEVQLSELIRGGVTTVLGVLGTDGQTRSVENLYAKTMALNEEGVTAYMTTGAYHYPGPTITGDPGRDIMYCEKVIGAKLALSDHRSSNIGVRELVALGSATRLAGMLSGKPGIVVLHMGDGHKGLQPVFEALKESDIPVGIFRPTHVGRNKTLREEAFRLLEMGGWIDFTCGSRKQGGPGRNIREAMDRGLPLEHITVSSDGHGSWSKYDKLGRLLQMGVAEMDNMFKELRMMVREQGFTLEEALPFFTSNVSAGLGMGTCKGVVREGADADLLLVDEDMNLQTVVALGQVMMEDGKLLKKGTYE